MWMEKMMRFNLLERIFQFSVLIFTGRIELLIVVKLSKCELWMRMSCDFMLFDFCHLVIKKISKDIDIIDIGWNTDVSYQKCW